MWAVRLTGANSKQGSSRVVKKNTWTVLEGRRQRIKPDRRQRINPWTVQQDRRLRINPVTGDPAFGGTHLEQLKLGKPLVSAAPHKYLDKLFGRRGLPPQNPIGIQGARIGLRCHRRLDPLPLHAVHDICGVYHLGACLGGCLHGSGHDLLHLRLPRKTHSYIGRRSITCFWAK